MLKNEQEELHDLLWIDGGEATWWVSFVDLEFILQWIFDISRMRPQRLLYFLDLFQLMLYLVNETSKNA